VSVGVRFDHHVLKKRSAFKFEVKQSKQRAVPLFFTSINLVSHIIGKTRFRGGEVLTRKVGPFFCNGNHTTTLETTRPSTIFNRLLLN
jgi:hypothetical protein